MKRLSKFIFILILALFLFSCGNNSLTSKVYENPVMDLYNKKLSAISKDERLNSLNSTKNELNKFTLFAAGDVMYHSPQLPAALGENGYDFTPSFLYIKDMIGENYAICNFESTIADENFSGYPMFRTPPAGIHAVKWAGFDIVSLANNHSLDGRKEGVIRTIEEADNAGLIHIGTYAQNDTRPYIYDFNGLKVALLCYTYGVNGLEGFLGNDQYMVNILDKEKIANDVAYAKENANGIIAMVHWGTEYKRYPTNSQLEWADYMASLGVDIILGSHPHVIEPAEIIDKYGKKTYVIYSMGNFISNQRKEYMSQPYSEDGVLLEMNIKRVDDHIELEEVKYHPTWVRKTKVNDKDFFEIIPTERALEGLIPELTENELNEIRKSNERTLNHLLSDWKK